MPPKDPPQVFVDTEMTLEQRISRLEELEVLRLAMHQTSEEIAATIDSHQRRSKLQLQLLEAQKKAAALIEGVVKTVRQRLGARDFHRSLPENRS